MAKRPRPRRPQSHLNSEIARQNLRSVLPDYWIINQPSDDYGIDWLIWITESEEVTGLHFFVQSKAPKHCNSKERVWYDLSLSTLSYLEELSSPIILHIFEQNSQTGYWLWLDEWYQENYASKWESQKFVRVSIPRENVFDKNAVQKIYDRVKRDNFRNRVRRNADIANKTHPHYIFSTHFDVDEVRVDIKHRNPNEAIPLTLHLDENSKIIFQRMLETGEAVSLKGELDHTLPEIIPIGDEPTSSEINVTPLVPTNYNFPAKWQFWDTEDKLLFEIPYVFMTLIQSGTKFKRWRGKATKYALILQLTIDQLSDESRINLNLGHDYNNRVVTSIGNYIEVFDLAPNITKFTVVNLKTDFDLGGSIRFGKQSTNNLPDHWRSLIKALETIESKFDIEFSLPDTISDYDLAEAEAIVKLITSGVAPQPLGALLEWKEYHFVIVYFYLDELKHLIRKLKDAQDDYIVVAPEHRFEYEIDLLGQKFLLGKMNYMFVIDEIMNMSALAPLLESGISENKQVEVHFSIVLEKSYCVFPRWANESSD